MTSAVQIQEANYVDPRAGNDKFYRTFVIDNSWVTQYGRNGTVGTFTKITETADHDAAIKAAAAKMSSKVKKGYTPTRSGTVNGIATLTDVTVLDEIANGLPTGQNPVPVEMAAPPVTDIDTGAVLPDQVDATVVALGAVPSTPAVRGDHTPELPLRPMLASVQDEQTVAAAMLSDRWVGQFKYDGDRVVIDVSGGEIRVLNRQGQAKTRNVGQKHLHPFTALHTGRWVFDGEVVGHTLVLFDIAAATDGDQTWVRDDTPFDVRYLTLTLIAGVLGIGPADASSASVVVAPVASSAEGKAGFLSTAVADQREGIVLRERGGAYEQGRRSTSLVKVKLVKDADVVVTALHPSKQSAELSVHDGDGELVCVGSASTIGKDAVAGPGGVEVGQTWVVKFLYVTDPAHPRLVQPRLIARRHDKTSDECGLDQFADAGTSKTV